MSKQRRKRIEQISGTRIRPGVEQLEQRVFPGGFLDLLVGAAFIANFDLLPEETLASEDVESEIRDASIRQGSPRLNKLGLEQSVIDDESSEERIKATRYTAIDLDLITKSNTNANSSVANSFFDSFFASNQFVDVPSVDTAAAPRHLSSSPVGQLGSGGGIGSRHNVIRPDSRQSNSGGATTVAPLSSASAFAEGEGTGEGNETPGGSNSPPEAYPASDTVLHDQQLFSTAAGYDIDGDTLDFSSTSSPSNGTLNFSGDGNFDYTPNAGYVGSDSFEFEVSDGSATDSATITIDVYNTAPTAYAASESVLHDQQLFANAFGDDNDNDPLTFSTTSIPSNGTLNFSNDGSFDYTPNAGYVGVDSFDFEVSDSIATANATITIDIYNNAPEATDGDESVLHDQQLFSTVEGFDLDAESLTFGVVAGPTAGALNLGADGNFDYTPNAGFVGNDSFDFSVDDGIAFDIGTFTIDVYNNAPVGVADDDYWGVDYAVLDVDASDGVLANDSDFDGDELTAILLAAPNHGVISLGLDGSFSYDAFDGYDGYDSFQYKASDGAEDSPPVLVTIAVGRVIIERDGVDVTDMTSTAWVGELTRLEAKIKGPINAELTKHAWTIPGKVVAGYTASEQEGIVLPFSDAAKNANPVRFYWVDAGTGRKVSVSTTLDGKFPKTLDSTFNIKRPNVTLTTLTSHLFHHTNDVVQFGSFEVLGGQPGADTEGIIFVRGQDMSGSSGTFTWTQIVDSESHRLLNDGTYQRRGGSNLLDGGVSYGGDVETADSPSDELGVLNYQLFDKRQDFRMYVMWKPDSAGAINVPIKMVSWGWDFNATWNADKFRWEVVGSSSQFPVGFDATDHPVWSDGLVQHLQWEADD